MSLKTIIVTGASGNLGQAVVKKFIDEEYRVIGTVHKTGSNSGDNNFEEAELDLLNEEDSQKFVSGVIEKYGAIDVAVLTAGGFVSGDIGKTQIGDITKQYQLNFETAYNIARPVFLQMMKQGSGRIFLIGSRQGLNILKGKGALAYGLSKSLLFRLAELLNEEAKNKNVVVNVIVPSVIDTPSNRESMPDANFSDWVVPSAIADVIYFYSSDAANAIREPLIKMYNNA
ncbi:MAG: SDR family NAD(P)-dependent oxidoreductase [Ginsengibacter sp.]